MGNTRWKSSLNVTGNISASGNGTITGTLAAASLATTAGIDAATGTVDTLTSTVATLTGFSSTNGTAATFTASTREIQGTAGAGVSIFGVGTVAALHKLNASGTVYNTWSSQGTAYKVHAGTAVLASGSVNVTTGLSSILGMSANAHNVIGTVAGTAITVVLFQPAAGTAAVANFAADGTGPAGTCSVSWTAVGT